MIIDLNLKDLVLIGNVLNLCLQNCDSYFCLPINDLKVTLDKIQIGVNENWDNKPKEHDKESLKIQE